MDMKGRSAIFGKGTGLLACVSTAGLCLFVCHFVCYCVLLYIVCHSCAYCLSYMHLCSRVLLLIYIYICMCVW